MDGMKRTESGASEVIGAVLLVSLVVIGGAVVASMVFGQPAPKEVPHVNFGVVKDDTTTLILHHTGGDSLQWGEYSVIVNGNNVTDQVVDKVNPWSSDGDMKIINVPQEIGSVVLAYRDGGGGETVLRKVDFEDHIPVAVTTTPRPWTISGYKLEVDSAGQVIGPPDREFLITLKKKTQSNEYVVVTTRNTRITDGYYIFDGLPESTEHYQLVETNQTGWRPFSPADGVIEDVKLTPGHIYAVNQNFTNQRYTPTETQTPTPTPTPTATTTQTVVPVIPTVTPTPTPEGGSVIYLDKRIGGLGYVVEGTSLLCDTTKKSFVTIGGTKYPFENGELVNFTIAENQTVGRLTVDKNENLVELTFNVTITVLRDGAWVTLGTGVPDAVLINSINKNHFNEQSSLTYVHPPADVRTEFRLDGQDVIPPLPNDTPLEFTDMHLVHDNSDEHKYKLNNQLWIHLDTNYNHVACLGDYVDISS